MPQVPCYKQPYPTDAPLNYASASEQTTSAAGIPEAAVTPFRLSGGVTVSAPLKRKTIEDNR